MILPQPNDGFRWTQAASGPALVCGGLDLAARHLFSTRMWPLGGGADRAWDDVATAIGVEPDRLIRVRQVHGTDLLIRRAGDVASIVAASTTTADIVISDDPGVAVAIQTADCVPLLIADRRTGAVAAAHAGWRGLAAGVPGITVNALARTFGSRPRDLIVAAGPSIRACCYEVGEEVRSRFERGGCSAASLRRWFVQSPQPTSLNGSMDGLAPHARPGHWYFDSAGAARDMIEAAGVPPDQIFVAGVCTASHSGLLCSFRRDGASAGRMAAVIKVGISTL